VDLNPGSGGDVTRNTLFFPGVFLVKRTSQKQDALPKKPLFHVQLIPARLWRTLSKKRMKNLELNVVSYEIA